MLKWYRKNARHLPWRTTKHPYKIWVSEIMLQQTQVKTVIPYYERFLKKFPTVETLAKADIDEVLKLWAGLGYYRRARQLHEAARKIAADFGGRIPETAEELQKLSGIGHYTAGAIASIAFDRKVPVLDGNVIRILTRIFAVRKDISSPRTIRFLWDVADSVMPSEHCGDFNQAMMELGATVCLPEKPECQHCPVSNLCKAHQKGKEICYPVRSKRERTEKISSAAMVIRKNGKVLIRKQQPRERWAGLWVFPYLNGQRHPEQLLPKFTIHHSFTKYRIRLNVFEHLGAAPTIKPPDHHKWVPVKKLDRYAFPSPHKKIADKLLEEHG